MIRLSQDVEVYSGNVMVKTKSDDSTENMGQVCDKKRICEFKPPETDDNIDTMSHKQFAPKSKTKILWAVNMYSQWRASRINVVGCAPQIFNANLDTFAFSKHDLCFALSQFICEVKKLDGTDYPPNTVRDLVLMIQMHLYQNGLFWKLLDNEEFCELRYVLDNTMRKGMVRGWVCIDLATLSL